MQAVAGITIPKTLEQAQRSPEWEKWKEAIAIEDQAFHDKDVNQNQPHVPPQLPAAGQRLCTMTLLSASRSTASGSGNGDEEQNAGCLVEVLIAPDNPELRRSTLRPASLLILRSQPVRDGSSGVAPEGPSSPALNEVPSSCKERRFPVVHSSSENSPRASKYIKLMLLTPATSASKSSSFSPALSGAGLATTPCGAGKRLDLDNVSSAPPPSPATSDPHSAALRSPDSRSAAFPSPNPASPVSAGSKRPGHPRSAMFRSPSPDSGDTPLPVRKMDAPTFYQAPDGDFDEDFDEDLYHGLLNWVNHVSHV